MRRDVSSDRPPLASDELLYVDPKLIGNRRRYARFLKDLERRGRLRFATWVQEVVGLFFVRKKSGSLRLIVDARLANLHFDNSKPPRAMAAFMSSTNLR